MGSYQHDHDKVLAYVNRLRSKIGRRPLKRLPKGYVRDAQSCPVANALMPSVSIGNYAEVDGTQIYVIVADDVVIEAKPPRYVRDFISRFDDGEFPQLIKAGA